MTKAGLVRVSIMVDPDVHAAIKEYVRNNKSVFSGIGHFYRAGSYRLLRDKSGGGVS